MQQDAFPLEGRIRARQRGRPAAAFLGMSPDAEHVSVSLVMSQPVLTVPSDAPLRRARDLMREQRIHHLMVEDRGRIVAILSDRDLWRALSPWADSPTGTTRDASTLDHPVFRVATYRLVTIPVTASIEEATARLVDHGISALPVVDDRDEIVGIVTSRDLLRGLLACALPG
jgi:acetoin utilization protein AcuB